MTLTYSEIVEIYKFMEVGKLESYLDSLGIKKKVGEAEKVEEVEDNTLNCAKCGTAKSVGFPLCFRCYILGKSNYTETI